MICFFDTETTGLPKNWKAPMKDVDNWPRVIQLAWHTTDLSGETIARKEVLILPQGWEIPVDKFWIDHGFNTLKSQREGIPIEDVLKDFTADLSSCEFLVSHNLSFDRNVLGAEMIRAGVSARKTVGICTKEASTNYCAIPFEGRRDSRPWVKQQYKWPKLEELHKRLFSGEDFADKHQAGGDVEALKNCFFKLMEIGVIEIHPQSAQQ